MASSRPPAVICLVKEDFVSPCKSRDLAGDDEPGENINRTDARAAHIETPSEYQQPGT
jgi:hypothetical protein